MNPQADYLEEQLRLARAKVAVLETELAQKSLLIREMDLMFGRMLLGMRAAVIEEEHGKGAENAMMWIFNGLVGPGELPPEEEKDAQAYFDREVKAIDEGMKQIMDERKAMAAAPAPVERLATDGGRNQRFEGLFEGETPDQRDARLASAAPVERVEQEAVAIWDDLTKLARATSNRHIPHGAPLYTTPQPAPTAAQDVAGLVEALEIIRDWSAFPKTGKTWDSGQPMSYGACYGSNGERDFMRNVAVQALAAHQSGGAK